MTTPTPIRAAGRAISIVLVVLGAIAGVFAIGGGVVDGVAAHGATDQTWSADADGARELRVTSSAADFDVVFADVDEATLVASSTGGPVQQWRLERSGDALVVETGWRWDGFGAGIFRFGDRGFGDEQVTLTLPEALERSGLALVTDISAGSFAASADWGRAELQLSAGSADLGGTADELDVRISAGEARLAVDSPRAVVLDVSAGRVVGALTGDQPDSIDAQVSAGAIELAIPDGEYAVTEDVSAGSAEIDVTDDRRAASTIAVEVSAGSVTLRGESR
ncbi:hypothetical protein [Agrococcus sp. HG114]|uniref:hypothetical protein n=1 Tax=Agrococcus sp. HG114 TaxID=2969757 RepID=UPI00215AFB43|nr:hypothetical protein [Agrococcus sp. HG114]MCR8671205.1 hypothetical protein [Agrococcus sp. HG114]